MDGLCRLLLNTEFCHGVCSPLVQHRTEIKVQADGHIVLGNKLLSSGQHPIFVAGIRDIPDTVSLVWTQHDICYELGDGGTTKSNGIPVHPCVLFTQSHREPGLTCLHSTALEPSLHEVAPPPWRWCLYKKMFFNLIIKVHHAERGEGAPPPKRKKKEGTTTPKGKGGKPHHSKRVKGSSAQKVGAVFFWC